MNDKGIELSFGWIFSLIVGGAILFLAIYAVSQLTDEERRVQQTFTAQELVTRLSMLTTSLESTIRPGNLSFSTQTRITPNCTLGGQFGTQKINVASRSGIGAPWNDNGIPAKSSGLYFFSATPSEGKSFSMLVKPILLPFKVGDSVTLWSGVSCFVQPTAEIQEDIALLEGSGNKVMIANRVQDCARNSTVVCFAVAGNIPAAKSACSIIVDVTKKTVEKHGRTVSYIDPLVYAAIFGDNELYECNVQRIMRRASFLAGLYTEKSAFVASRSQEGCSSALQTELAEYRSIAKNGTSRSLGSLLEKALELDENNPEACSLWKEELR